ncbi:MAG: hypothetical protein RBS36_04950 [Thiomicrospira sp.]|nr:hypothetical protein [Thiomicrospira sp.]
MKSTHSFYPLIFAGLLIPPVYATYGLSITAHSSDSFTLAAAAKANGSDKPPRLTEAFYPLQPRITPVAISAD